MKILYWLKPGQVGQSAAMSSRVAAPAQRALEGWPQRFRPPALHGPTRKRELRVTASSRGRSEKEVALPATPFAVAALHLPQLQRSWLRAPHGLAGQRGISEKIHS